VLCKLSTNSLFNYVYLITNALLPHAVLPQKLQVNPFYVGIFIYNSLALDKKWLK